MSTDSTELTFVRCPSCRSLVPAISTRCRMCGATLEASAVPESGDAEQRKSGRVRQRTMSESSSDLHSAAQQAREEVPPPPPPPPPAPPKAASVAPVIPVVVAPVKEEAPAEEIEDPLSAYIEEVEMKEEPAAPVKAQEPIEEEEVEEEPIAPVQMRREPPQPVSPPPAFDDDDSDDDVEDLLSALDEEPEEPAPVKPTPPAQPRVVVESGNRKPGGKSQLGFSGSPREQTPAPQAKAEQPERPKPQVPQGFTARPEVREETPRPEPKPQPPQQPRREARPEQPPQQQNRQQNQGGQQQRQPQQQQQQPRREARPEQPPQQQNRQQQQQNRPQQQPPQRPSESREQQKPQREAREERPQQQETAPVSRPPSAQPAFNPGAAKTEAAAGRLFGWLVNYTDPNGAAVEVREGKFFVSAKSVKPSDLVIDDRTISSPHALLTVSPATGLMVQDLMSERGVFVRKKGSDTYKKEEETVGVSHGDWLRFGDIEFLVSLIAHPGEV